MMYAQADALEILFLERERMFEEPEEHWETLAESQIVSLVRPTNSSRACRQADYRRLRDVGRTRLEKFAEVDLDPAGRREQLSQLKRIRKQKE